uniref:Uncharacterized protein n=1 Tax=Desertifilum tharense IPPAS B-1220 TaxID=1781255 RepID=A0ACD5GRA7_9CYAN
MIVMGTTGLAGAAAITAALAMLGTWWYDWRNCISRHYRSSN